MQIRTTKWFIKGKCIDVTGNYDPSTNSVSESIALIKINEQLPIDQNKLSSEWYSLKNDVSNLNGGWGYRQLWPRIVENRRAS